MNTNHKTNSIQLTLTVKRKVYITPHYIRVFLTGNVKAIANNTVGMHNKIFIPPKGLNEIYFPEFDTNKRQWIYPSEQFRPIVRTYTLRGIDLINNEIWIDFVAHGDEGIASAWAISATEGDILGLAMKDKRKVLYPKVKNYILVGDATAIPVISAILEDLPPDATGHCIIEVHGKEDEQHLHTKADMLFHWLHNNNPYQGSTLNEAVNKLTLPHKDRYFFAAGEFSSIKKIRNYLKNEKEWQREEMSVISYWKAGESEENSVALRRQEILNE